MRMQEPEQYQQPNQEWSTERQFDYTQQQKQEYEQQQGYESPSYQAGYSNDYAAYAQEKIDPRQKRKQRSKVPFILLIIFSSIGFGLSVTGIVLSSLALQHARQYEASMTPGVIGLVSSIIVMVACILLFVLAVVVLSLRAGRAAMRRRYMTFRIRI